MEIPRHWRLKAQRYRLEGSICPTCGQLTFPPRPVCPHCTAQPLRIDTCGPSVLTTSIGTTGIESYIPYEFIERMIG
ncbi:MAG: zinc ribbon domain-containing protein [Anaerolineales bacterium]